MYTRLAFLWLFVVEGAILAQSTSGICGQTDPPCVDQPTEGDRYVTGQVLKPDAGQTVTVKLTEDSAKFVPITITSTDSTNFSFPVQPLKTSNVLEVQFGSATALKVSVAPASSTVYTLGLVGVNATGASSAGPSQQYFVSFDVLTPLPIGKEPKYPLKHKWWVWADPRIASLPTANTSALSSIGSASGLSTGAGSQTIGSITQSFEFQGGLEYHLRSPWKGAQFGSNSSWARTSVSLIAGGGFVTPFNTSAPSAEYSLNTNLGQEFNQTPSLAAQYPQLAAALCGYGFTGGSATGVTCPTPAASTKPTSVAFVLPSRSRFYRDYYAGIRLRTFYLSGQACDYANKNQSQVGCKLQSVYPGTIDLRFGQDESVTQHLAGVVLTLAGTYPLPGTGGTVRVFGSAYLGLRRDRISTPLILVPSSTVATLDQSSVVVQPIAPTDQDYFRLGLGVDLVPLISKWVNSSSK